MDKKGVLLLFLLLIPILLLANVSAKTSCAIRTVENCTGENGVIVFRLSGTTNAHGEVFDLAYLFFSVFHTGFLFFNPSIRSGLLVALIVDPRHCMPGSCFSTPPYDRG
ncbi:MAG: hypothetical protein RBT06_09050 [Smithellaceae bacterium]|jgi:hypothetical protein|nr:hypothetical protein [Smithellaceae bacterium]